MRVVWAPRALDRVANIARTIAEDNPAAARRWVVDLFARVRSLQELPEQGRIVPEIGRDDTREILFGRYRVVYRREEKRVLVLTVRHQRRQWNIDEQTQT